MSNHAEERLKRLRWKCRRGMLELDLILCKFLDTGYRQLSSEQVATFEQLLEEDDPKLESWFMRQSVPEREDFAKMIAYINKSIA